MTEQNNGHTEAVLEEGRLLFSGQWDFIRGVPSLNFLPPEGPLEVAFAGRSNVGKSSLLNALTGQKGLARTSNTPGRTQELNYFIPSNSAEVPALAIVDMPGYGYAQAPKKKVDAWTKLVFEYLRGRSTLRRVFVLVDSRHGLKKNDEEVLDLLDTAAVSYQIVLTKTDKIKAPALVSLLDKVHSSISKRAASHPLLIATSSEKNVGIAQLRAAIAELLH